MNETQNKSYLKPIVTLAVLWVVVTLVASATLVFQSVRYLIDVAACVPLISLGLGCLLSPSFRKYIMSVDVKVLTFLEAWRVIGFGLVPMGLHGILPWDFAAVGGFGDLAVGTTAPLAALFLATRGRRAGFIAWQIFGLIDISTAIALSVLTSPGINIHNSSITTAPLAVLPLSLVPTVFVPMLTSFQLISIAQALSWNKTNAPRALTRIVTQAVALD